MKPDMKKTRFLFHDFLHINRLIKAVIDLHWDFSVVDRQSSRNWAESMNPSRQLVSRKMVSDIINRSKVKLRAEIVTKLESAVSVALTFDLWSARKGSRSFGCITAHYISNDWEIENLILQFERLPYPHDGETIRAFIAKTIEENALQEKIISITSDNASNNIAAFRLLDKSSELTPLNLGIVHYKCVAHIIDLALKSALKNLANIVTPVREAVLAIRSSMKRKEAFIAEQAELIEAGVQTSKSPLELAEDVDHR